MKAAALLVFTLVTQFAQSQTIVPRQSVSRVADSLFGVGDQILLHGSLPQGGSVTVVSQLVAALSPGINGRLIIRDSEGKARVTVISGIQPRPLALLESTLFFVRINPPTGGPFQMCALDLATGRETSLALTHTPRAALSHNSEVLLFGVTALGDVMLSRVDRDLKISTIQLRGVSDQQISRAVLASHGDSRVLIVDVLDATYLPLSLNPSPSIGGRVELKGSLVERSKNLASGAGRLRQRIVLGHAMSAGGDDLFFFGPYKVAEGYAVAEFDESGQQKAIYRLTTGPGSGQLVQVADTSETIQAVNNNGAIYVYERP